MVYELGGQQIWVQVTALLLPSVVTWDNLLSSLSLPYLICKINIILSIP